MENKKQFNYWEEDENDSSYIDPTKRPTSIEKNKLDIDDYWIKVERKKPSESAVSLGQKIDQDEELEQLDDMNLNNNAKFSNDESRPLFNANELQNRWNNVKNNVVQEKMATLRERAQEPLVTGKRKYSFFIPDSLDDLVKKPEIVLDATPRAGDFNVPFQGYNSHGSQNSLPIQEDETVELKPFDLDHEQEDEIKFNNDFDFTDVNNDFEITESTTNEENDYDQLDLPLDEPEENLSVNSFLNRVRNNIAASKKEAIFINDEDVLDPNNLTTAQRLRLLKAANDPNNKERELLLKMKLNSTNGIGTLGQVVKERLQQVNSGKIELVEDNNDES
ncbi:hypothetical protein SSYRP_v1c04970 [Spiroplasma syrphidicola EA-1]|uniref:Uncharacterized protein n=1 Tax=Spiroplasma syrphidicola EA-1 TaxID=1276229 RepID=R4UDW7_9MOLU|nr:hypothetical protein [Spiroplasma syrphidicola]AGM26089.1 hypothetical protein SSYRP_v1c04970 [Spiroplasma syrphidicola EA-1]